MNANPTLLSAIAVVLKNRCLAGRFLSRCHRQLSLLNTEQHGDGLGSTQYCPCFVRHLQTSLVEEPQAWHHFSTPERRTRDRLPLSGELKHLLKPYRFRELDVSN
jgi:hypothetical protein